MKPFNLREPARHGAATLVAALVVLLALAGSAGANASILDRLKALGGIDATETAASDEEVGLGLKEALAVGTANVVDQLGQPGGFNLDPEIHIPLPKGLRKVNRLLRRVGMGDMLTDLESRLNQAAEVATPKARELFVGAIQDMTLDDVMKIYKGPDDAATQYFRSKMSAPLTEAMTPVVAESLADVGAVEAMDGVMARYEDIPFASRVDVDLTGYVVEKGMDGIFYYLAREEAAIRKDPVKRTTDLLKKVFGQ